MRQCIALQNEPVNVYHPSRV